MCGTDHAVLHCLMGPPRKWMDEQGRIFLDLDLDNGATETVLLSNAGYTDGQDWLMAALRGPPSFGKRDNLVCADCKKAIPGPDHEAGCYNFSGGLYPLCHSCGDHECEGPCRP